MGKMFDNIEIGDQLELMASHCIIYGDNSKSDPNAVRNVKVVTHIWYDPVDNKEYVGLAQLKPDGSYGRPTEKRTLTGLARVGWRKARINWLERCKALKSADKNVVISFNRRH